MSAMETRMADRRAAARDAAERRKKIILVVLAVVLVAVLAFELPKLLKGSSSSPSAAATSVTTPATRRDRSGASSDCSRVGVGEATRAIRRLAPRDPFVPLIKDSASTSTSRSSPPSPATRVTPLGDRFGRRQAL